MIRFFPIILLFSVPESPVYGQRIYSAQWPARLEENTAYVNLVSEKEETLAEARRELQKGRDAGLSENLLFYLDLAVDRFAQAQSPEIQKTLSELGERRELSGIDTHLLTRIETRVIRINRQLAHLERVYRFEEESMNRYPADTLGEGIREEILFYQLSPGSRVAEIGAGDGSFAAVLATLAPEMTLYINEIDQLLLDEISYHIQHNPAFQIPGSWVCPVIGDPASTGLEGVPLDAVLIRNAIHHFDEPAAILQSIYSSLEPDGKLYIKERFREICTDRCCDRLISRDHLLELFRPAGFQLTAEEAISGDDGPWILMRFSPVNRNDK